MIYVKLLFFGNKFIVKSFLRLASYVKLIKNCF